MAETSPNPSHFNGKDAIGHVAEAQAKGMISAAEIHGTEIPGPVSAGADSARDTAFLLLLLSLFLPSQNLLINMTVFSLGLLIFRAGRSAWLGWFRLERLHRVLEQEKWEIDHNRDQERAELKELYRAKGFEGKLLDDVIGVLMSDGDRLLKVMVEEELGLSLENVEHPLQQGFGSALGVILAASACLLGLWFFGNLGLLVLSLLSIGIAAILTASFARNRKIPAIVWNLAFGIVAYGVVFFILKLVR